MSHDFHGKELFVWMQLIGFDREKPDCGASEYLGDLGFVPDGICALLYHPDIVHLHRGMDAEWALFPDNCSYRASARNALRDRQPWTNYDLRALSRGIKKAGSGLYMSIMGIASNNEFHREWIYDHPEVMYDGKKSRGGLNALKRFSDGTYYEDFFIDRCVRALCDYEMDGVQIADGFCPSPGMRHDGDFSTDMVEQFLAHAGLRLPEPLMQAMGSDESADKTARGEYIWRNLRERWLAFYAWRWARFYEKLCARARAAGKKVIVLGMYCTDPFETLYCIGLDLRAIVRAGVDYIMPNILPTSVYMQADFRAERPYYFHRYMAIVPLVDAFVPEGRFLSMLAVHDTTEEWDVLRHAPTKFERDLYAIHSYQAVDGAGSHNSMDGLMLCLGDGLTPGDWDWMSERIGIATSMKAASALSPTILWSDAAFDAALPDYMRTRRWTAHKFAYEIFKRGTPLGAAVRVENLERASGPLFAPNVDLCPPPEIEAIARYRGGPVLMTAAAGFDPAPYGIAPDARFADADSRFPMAAFSIGAPLSGDLLKELGETLNAPDDAKDLEGDLLDAPEFAYTLLDTLSFSKVSEGFARLCARWLRAIVEARGPFSCDVPCAAYRLEGGGYRLYLYNTLEDIYAHARVEANAPIGDVRIVSKYPILPVTFVGARAFKTKLAPAGVTILDVAIPDAP